MSKCSLHHTKPNILLHIVMTYILTHYQLLVNRVSCAFQIDFLQGCQTQINDKIDEAQKEKSTEKEYSTKNESSGVCHNTASNFNGQKNTPISFLNVRVI